MKKSLAFTFSTDVLKCALLLPLLCRWFLKVWCQFNHLPLKVICIFYLKALRSLSYYLKSSNLLISYFVVLYIIVSSEINIFFLFFFLFLSASLTVILHRQGHFLDYSPVQSHSLRIILYNPWCCALGSALLVIL